MRQSVFLLGLAVLLAGCGGGGSGVTSDPALAGQWYGTFRTAAHQNAPDNAFPDGSWQFAVTRSGSVLGSGGDLAGNQGIATGTLSAAGDLSLTMQWDAGGAEAEAGHLGRQPDGTYTGAITCRWTKAGMTPGAAVGNSVTGTALFRFTPAP